MTMKKSYMLPRIDKLLEQLKGVTWFSEIDLASGYHQIIIDPANTRKTAFQNRCDHYKG